MIQWFKNLMKRRKFEPTEEALRIIKAKRTFWLRDKTRLEFKHFTQLIVDQFQYQFFVQNQKFDIIRQAEDYCYQLSQVRQMRDDDKRNHEIQLIAKDEIIVAMKQDARRFELEVIHLKELIQEKNMVIDKLLAEKTNEIK